MVTVSNLHGFAGRVVRAHGELIGFQGPLELPSSDWVSDQCKARSLSYSRTDDVKRALQRVKQQAFSDDEVLRALRKGGDQDAVDIELQRVAEGVLTYDDLLRLAELILAHEGAAKLYRAHFACVVVDEFQDLTMQQLRVVQRIGYGRTTYAGDVAQGIYSFAGADPDAVLSAIREETKLELPLTESYRSSPAVLAAVNALIPRTGGTELHCASPSSWPGGGIVFGASFKTVEIEAAWVVRFARRILKTAPTHRVGIITRSGSRRRFVDETIVSSDLTWHRWDDPLMDAATCAYMKKLVDRLRLPDNLQEADALSALSSQADLTLIEEPDTRKGVAEAIRWMAELLEEGVTLDEIAGRIKTAHSTKLLDAPGAHLLSGHVGKGQQFDWVVIVGLEEGVLPNFNATTEDDVREEARVLSVMLSRARHGAAVTRSASVPALSGVVYDREASRFVADLREAGTLAAPEEVKPWFTETAWAESA